ncbi:hypothetical protein AMTR_s00032p00108340 [Amborella trichopoda]|uniref:Uncharacterized protein n=1 Tax=Amborella trichopoda TaxID=13333 RepID=U5D0A3_AMBTC|nr:hypothetical protein AMTR_s00032p00108340 [Amborella trichopoda]
MGKSTNQRDRVHQALRQDHSRIESTKPSNKPASYVSLHSRLESTEPLGKTNPTNSWLGEGPRCFKSAVILPLPRGNRPVNVPREEVVLPLPRGNPPCYPSSPPREEVILPKEMQSTGPATLRARALA